MALETKGKTITRIVEITVEPDKCKGKQHFRACLKIPPCPHVDIHAFSGSFTPVVATTLTSPSTAIGLPNYFQVINQVVSLIGNVSASLMAVPGGTYSITVMLPVTVPAINTISNPIGTALPGAISLSFGTLPRIVTNIRALVASSNSIAFTFTLSVILPGITDTLTVGYSLAYTNGLLTV